jgi:hypothetical protein
LRQKSGFEGRLWVARFHFVKLLTSQKEQALPAGSAAGHAGGSSDAANLYCSRSQQRVQQPGAILKRFFKRPKQTAKCHPVRRSSATTGPHSHASAAFSATCCVQDSGASHAPAIVMPAPAHMGLQTMVFCAHQSPESWLHSAHTCHQHGHGYGPAKLYAWLHCMKQTGCLICCCCCCCLLHSFAGPFHVTRITLLFPTTSARYTIVCWPPFFKGMQP